MTDEAARLASALADRYRIERELGAGGMATVWLAEDLKHRRKVAVKVLHPELAEAVGHDRFLREITTTANLRHPHILPLYDSGEAGGFLYYVMPYVEGESLRDRLEREGPLPVEDALRIAGEVADALSYAHARDVIHRDIKPENILLESGHAVVADFGIARAVSEAGGEKLTQTGVSIGTPAYMSPEQASGAAALDGRSDLYSLGCLLYEMLAGQPPFTGPVASLVHQHLMVTPRPITELRPTVPADVAGALQRALAKNPADRFSPIATFTAAIRGAGTASVMPPGSAPAGPRRSKRRAGFLVAAVVVVGLAAGAWWLTSRGTAGAGTLRRLAILPLTNMMADSSEAYFVDGMHDQMITELGKVHELVVLAPTSVLGYRDTDLPAPRIARELRVDGLIEGSVFRAGDSVRINVRLIQAEPERTLWTESYEGTLGEALGLHRRVAQAVAREVRVSLGAEESKRLGAVASIPPAAQESYLRGLAALRTRTLDGIDASITLLRDAVRLAPEFADGWGALAEAEWFWGAYHESGLTPAAMDSAIERARTAAGNALRIDDAQPAAMTVMAQAQRDPNDWNSVISGLRHTVEVNPNYAQAWNLLGDALGATGQLDEGLETHRRAQLLDPFHPVFSRDVAISLLLLGRYADAEQEIRRALDIEPHVSLGRITLIQVLMLEQKFDAAADEETKLLTYLGASAGLLDSFHSEYERGGWHGALAWLLELKPADLPDVVGDPAVDMLGFPGTGTAFALAWLGRKAEALDALERTFPPGDKRVAYRLWVKSHPFLASLRGEPRYQELLRRLNLDGP